MGNKKIKLGLVLTLACLMLVGLTACGGGASEFQQQLVEVTRGDIVMSVTAEGNLSLPWHRELAFGTSGTITEINVEEGDRVVKGQLLATLDITSLEQAVKSAEMAVASAEIDLESAQNSYDQLITPYPFLTFAFALPESLDAVRAAQSKITEAQKELVLGLKGESYSMAEMKENLMLAQESLSEAEAKLDAGLSEGISPSETYWTMRAAQLTVDKAQVALDSAKNSLGIARTELDKAVMLAPFDGVVAAVDAREGDKLSSFYYATTTILEVIDPSIMELKSKVDEIDVPDLALGQKAIIEVDAIPALLLEGEVTYLDPVSTEESGVVLYEVTVSFDVPPGSGLRSGMSATAEAVIDERLGVLLVPNRAVEYEDQDSPVVKVMVDEQIEERSVVLGLGDGYDTEVISGLSEGEIVVIERKAESSTGGFFGG